MFSVDTVLSLDTFVHFYSYVSTLQSTRRTCRVTISTNNTHNVLATELHEGLPTGPTSRECRYWKYVSLDTAPCHDISVHIYSYTNVPAVCRRECVIVPPENQNYITPQNLALIHMAIYQSYRKETALLDQHYQMTRNPAHLAGRSPFRWSYHP